MYNDEKLKRLAELQEFKIIAEQLAKEYQDEMHDLEASIMGDDLIDYERYISIEDLMGKFNVTEEDLDAIDDDLCQEHDNEYDLSLVIKEGSIVIHDEEDNLVLSYVDDEDYIIASGYNLIKK